ncbi:PAS domain-containing protein [Variovorax sp. EBFNA2]|uniref:helix-turn-helix transcriptional regulator n=1 Tax=Variovorax sp. EBFNA2 TaxID=3342097 RepID=UPI0029BFAE4A|nr:PAS domain-containing protein [Variovorax boronicumulans]WPG41582.1 PAS domain-containing protein [Variovorax boronicumulans]
MSILRPVVDLMAQILPPNTELVLHDLTHPDTSVIAIANGQVSGRTVGSPILSGPKDDQAFAVAFATTTEASDEGHAMVGVYPTVSPAGTPLKSATVIFRSKSGVPLAALCANVDLQMLKLVHAWIGRAIDGPSNVTVNGGAHTETADMDTLMAEIIESAVQNLGKPVLLMTKDEKSKAVEEMLRRGLFIVKGSVPRAAKALGLSRYTVYNYLEEIRQREKQAPPKRKSSTTVTNRASVLGQATARKRGSVAD